MPKSSTAFSIVHTTRGYRLRMHQGRRNVIQHPHLAWQEARCGLCATFRLPWCIPSVVIVLILSSSLPFIEK